MYIPRAKIKLQDVVILSLHLDRYVAVFREIDGSSFSDHAHQNQRTSVEFDSVHWFLSIIAHDTQGPCGRDYPMQMPTQARFYPYSVDSGQEILRE